MMQRLTFPFPFVHHQTHDWLLSVLEFEGGLAIAGTLFSHPKVNSCPTFCGINQRMSHQQWKVEQLLTVETRTNLPFVSSVFTFQLLSQGLYLHNNTGWLFSNLILIPASFVYVKITFRQFQFSDHWIETAAGRLFY